VLNDFLDRAERNLMDVIVEKIDFAIRQKPPRKKSLSPTLTVSGQEEYVFVPRVKFLAR
jgi:hypothetical protein